MAIGFESLLPSVYFERIILDTSARAEYTETNPHIDHEREPKFVVNVKTGKIETETINPNLAKKKDNSEHLIIRLDLMVKEKLDNSAVSTWFDDQDMLKYLKVKILQISDEDITNNLANGIYTIFYEGLYNKKEVISKSVFLKDIKKDQLDNYDFEYDDEGNRIYNIPFNVEFQLTNLNPKHLTYFAAAYLDVESMAKDYEMDLPPGNIKAVMGRIASEIVIKEVDITNFSSVGVKSDTLNAAHAHSIQVVSESYVFFTEQEQVWDGPVHVLNNRWMSGIEGDPDAKPLRIQTVVNAKIQDFRDRKEIEKLINDFSVIENELLGNQNVKILTNNNLNINRKVSYFSNFNLARDSEGQCRFLFGVDFLRMAKEQTVYGNFYRNSDVELLEHIRIKSLVLRRVRVSNTRGNLLNDDGIAPFDQDTDIPDLIAFSNEAITKQLIKNEYVTRKEDTDSKRIGVIRELEIELNNQFGIRHFTGVDYDMKDVTFGFYKYLVELEIEDKTSEFLERKVGELLEAYNELKIYYDEASTPNHYDVYTNRFSTDYISELENYYANDVGSAPWIFSISTFLAVIDALYTGVNIKKFSNSLYLFTHPRSGGPDSILMVLEVIDKFVNSLSNLIGIKLAGSSNKFQKGKSQTAYGASILKSKVPIRTFLVKSYSAETFDSDIPKKIGYDYLSNGELELESNDDGLKVVSNVKFEERTNLETLKYFVNTTVDINVKTDAKTYTVDDHLINSKYTYLTPSNINFGKQVSVPLVGQGVALYEPVKSSVLATQITQFNLARKSPQITMMPMRAAALTNIAMGQTQTRTSMTQIFAEKGVSAEIKSNVAPISKPVSSVLSQSPTMVEMKSSTPLIASKGVVGSSSMINKEDSHIEEFSKSTLDNHIGKMVNIENALMPVMNFVNNNVQSNVSINNTALRKNTSGLLESVNLKNTSNIIDKIMNSKSSAGAMRIAGTNLGGNVAGSLLMPKSSFGNNVAGSYIKSLPNQIKSLIVGNLSSVGKVVKAWDSGMVQTTGRKVKPDDSLAFQANYQNIKQIEVLDGYEICKGGIQIKRQNWVKLTAETFKKSISKNLLCRMIPFQDKVIGIDNPKGLDLPSYNEYFILSPEEKITNGVNLGGNVAGSLIMPKSNLGGNVAGSLIMPKSSFGDNVVSVVSADRQKILASQMVSAFSSVLGKVPTDTVAVDVTKSKLSSATSILSKTTSLPTIQRNKSISSVAEIKNVNPISPLKVDFNVNVGSMSSQFSADISKVNQVIENTLGVVKRKSEEKPATVTVSEISPITGYRVLRKS